MSPNIIQELLAKSVEKLQKQQMVEEEKDVKIETFTTRTDKSEKIFKPKEKFTRQQSNISSTVKILE